MSTERDMLNSKEGCEALLSRYGTLGAIAKALGYVSGRSFRDRFRRFDVEYDRRPGSWTRAHAQNVGSAPQVPTVSAPAERSPQNETREAIVERQKSIRIARERRLTHQLLERAALEQMILEALQEAITPLPSPVVPDLYFESRGDGDSEAAVCVISDTQIGKKTRSYDSKEFVRRLRSLAVNIVKVATLHRNMYPIDELVLMMAGDIVDGESIYPGHAFGVDQSVINQVFRTGIPAFTEMLSLLCLHFPRIRIVAVPGNHGRNSKFAAVETNWDRVFFLGLQLAVKDWKQIQWELPADDEFFVLTEVNGHRFLVLHGDEIPIWMNIPYYGIERSSSRWAQSMPRQWDYLVMGHFHQAAWLKSNAKEIIMNGAFPTDDPYVLKRLKLDSTDAVQWFFGVHPARLTWRYEMDLLKPVEWPE